MGASASVDLRPEEVAELQDISSFEPKEITKLYKRFRRLDRGGRGTISADDVLMIPEIAMNPLAQRLTVIFDKDSEDRINFKSFVAGLSIFNGKTPKDVKSRAIFRIYDVDGDGFIGQDDVKRLVDMMAGSTLSPESKAGVVAVTIRQGDWDRDGKISFEEFSRLGDLTFSIAIKQPHYVVEAAEQKEAGQMGRGQ